MARADFGVCVCACVRGRVCECSSVNWKTSWLERAMNAAGRMTRPQRVPLMKWPIGCLCCSTPPQLCALPRIWLLYSDQFELPSLLIAPCIFMLTMFSSNLYSGKYFIQSLCKAGPKSLPITFCYFIILQLKMPWMTSPSLFQNPVQHGQRWLHYRWSLFCNYL